MTPTVPELAAGKQQWSYHSVVIVLLAHDHGNCIMSVMSQWVIWVISPTGHLRASHRLQPHGMFLQLPVPGTL